MPKQQQNIPRAWCRGLPVRPPNTTRKVELNCLPAKDVRPAPPHPPQRIGWAAWPRGTSAGGSLAFDNKGVLHLAIGDTDTGKLVVRRAKRGRWETVGDYAPVGLVYGWINLAFSPTGTMFVGYAVNDAAIGAVVLSNDGTGWTLLGDPSSLVGGIVSRCDRAPCFSVGCCLWRWPPRQRSSVWQHQS